MRLIFASVFLSLFATATLAWDRLSDPFDPNELNRSEKRLLQAGLSLEGTYRARLDGLWGNGSWRALRAAVPNPTWRSVAQFVKETEDRLNNDRWSISTVPGTRMSYLVLQRDMNRDIGGGASGWRSLNGDLHVRGFATDAGGAQRLHSQLRRSRKTGTTPYTLDRDNVLVTSVDMFDLTSAYARSDVISGRVPTVLVQFNGVREADARLVIASIQASGQTLPAVARGGAMARAIEALSRPEPQPAPQPAPSRNLEDQLVGVLNGILGQQVPGLSIGISRDNDTQPAPSVPQFRLAKGMGLYFTYTDILVPNTLTDDCGADGLASLNGPKLTVVKAARAGMSVVTSARRSDHWVTFTDDSLQPRAFGLQGVSLANVESADLQINAAQVLGQFEASNRQTRYITTLPTDVRNTGAPILNARGHVVGMITGPVDAPNASATERDSLRDVSQAIATRDIRRLLQRQRIVHDSAASASSDAQRAVVALVCGG